MTAARIWDVAITKRKNGSGFQLAINFPSELGVALDAKGVSRASLRLTDEGILVTPYVGEPLEIPSWGPAHD